MKPGQFLDSIFSGLDKGFVVLWRSDTRNSLWVEPGEYEKADSLAEECRASSDAGFYYGVCAQDGPADGRGTEATTLAMPGLWCDLDLAEGSAGKKSSKPYPPREAAESVLKSLPLQPSVVVNSGGGLHVYWLLHELHGLNAENRKAAAGMVKGWQGLIEDRLRKVGGFALDHVHDLARVLRPVGSWNHRAKQIVTLADGFSDPDRWPRYELSDFEPYAETRLVKGVEQPRYLVGELTLSSDANPPLEMYNALRENCPEFRKLYDHKKTMPSNSEYELAIANIAVEAQWTDQQIAWLLIAHRREHEPDKLAKLIDRKDYLANTIAKARTSTGRVQALRQITGVEPSTAIKPSADPGGEPVVDKAAIKDQLSIVFGVKITGWIQLGKSNPLYTLVLAGGVEVEIGSSAQVVEGPRCFTSAIYAATGVTIPPVSRKDWRKVCEHLAQIVTVLDDDDSGVVAAVTVALTDYLRIKDVYSHSNRDDACQLGEAFREDGWVHVPFARFTKFLAMHNPEKFKTVQIVNAMRRLGFQSCHVSYSNTEGVRTTRRYQRSSREL